MALLVSDPPRSGSSGPGGFHYPPSTLPQYGVSRRFSICRPQTAREQDQRECPRRSLRCVLVLIDTTTGKDAGVAIPAECGNLSNGGLYAIVPMGYGVAIGRRYTFQLAVGECGPESASRQLLSQQGEVIRAELLIEENGYADHVGIGVRLSGPCAGLVPMSVPVGHDVLGV